MLVCKRLADSYKYMYENCAGGVLDALVIVQYMHAVYNCFYGKWFAFDRSLYKEARSSVKLQGWWQANQSVKTISIYRRTAVNSDCGAVSAVGRVSAFLARGSVTAIGSTPVLALELVLRRPPTACGDGGHLGRFTGEEMRTRN